MGSVDTEIKQIPNHWLIQGFGANSREPQAWSRGFWPEDRKETRAGDPEVSEKFPGKGRGK